MNFNPKIKAWGKLPFFLSYKFKYREFVFLGFILLIAIGLRFYNISYESYWLDEVISVERSSKPFGVFIRDFPKDIRSDNNPPVYNILLYVWMFLFGFGEGATRTLSGLLGIISIFLIYLVGRTLYSSKVALLGAFLLSVSLVHIQYSQETRAYSMLIMMSLLSCYFFIKAVKERKTFGYFFSTVILIYTHVLGVLVFISQGIYYLVYRKLFDSKILTVQLVIGLFGVVLAIFMYQFVNYGGVQNLINTQGRSPSILNPYSFFIPLANFSNVWIHSWIGIPYIFLICYIMILGVGRKSPILSYWFFIPLIILYFISILKIIPYHTRYFLLILPAFYLLCSVGFFRLNSKIKTVSICLFLIVTVYNLYLFQSYTKKNQWRQVVASVSSQHNDDDLVVLIGLSPKPFNFYSHHRIKIIKMPGWPVILNTDLEEYKKNMNSFNRLWVVVGSGDGPKLQSETMNYLFSGYRFIKFEQFNGVLLSLIEKT